MEKFSYMLAPLENISSNAFRTICYRYGADVTFTELIRVQGLAMQNKNTLLKIKFQDDTPTIIQLLGAKEEYFEKFLKGFEPLHNFKGFNLNLGCPDPEVIKLGQGCAMIRKINKTKKIAKIFRDYGYGISIKMRLGLNNKDKENKVYLNLMDAIDADFFVVHARHGAQTYNEPADFTVYDKCVKTGKNIIANGDIKTKEQAEFLKDKGVKGAMIGRAAVLDPSIFNRLKGVNNKEKILKEYLELAEKFKEPLKYRKNTMKWLGKKNFTETYLK